MASLLRSRSVLSVTAPSAIRSSAFLSTQSCMLGTRTLSTLRTSQLQVGPLPHRTSSRTQSHTYRVSRRTASTATRAQSELPAAARVHVLRSPSEADLEAAEVDAELLPPKDIAFQLTERAAEQLRRIAQRESDTNVALRVSVESGGCHGYQYKMDLSSLAEAAPEDYQLSHPEVRPSAVLVDAVSLPLLNGATLDFATELIGSSFRIVDNPNATGAGCGCGVSWELKA